jgi:hypothetical protein
MTTKKPSPYVPSFLRAALEGARPLQLTFSEVSDTNILSTSSFIYDPQDAPLKSTQQLNVDWSKFENHTFFMSAEAKVNLAFEQVINGFPFDGTRQEVEQFFEKMTGFDRYVFDSFPKFHGQLAFTGSQIGEASSTAGTYIIVKDAAGSLYPDLSKTTTGQSVLNPRDTSLSIEMQLFLPVTATMGTQVVCQKLNGDTQGFSLYLTPTVSTSSVEARFSVVSGAFSLTVPCNLDKGRFNHICVELNRETSAHYLEFFKSNESAGVTKSRFAFGDFDIDASDFIIGSGTAMTLGATTVTPNQTLSGTLDELRVFHSIRTAEQQQLFASKAIFAQPDLKLYYRFNEPPPPLATNTLDQANAIVIDSSGNSLHSTITNFFTNGSSSVETSVSTNANDRPLPVAGQLVVSSSLDSFTSGILLGNVVYFATATYHYAKGGPLRQDSSKDPNSNVIYEKEESVPVLFPAYADVIELNAQLLESASVYDKANPNLITRLVPQHYLLEGALFDGYEEPEGYGGNPYAGSGIPGEGKLGSVQLFLSLLYIWARFFDEMKLYIDAFSTLRTVSYDTNISMPNNFLRDLVRQYGFYMPPLFNDSNLEQYVYAENVGLEISSNETPLKHVQNELLRRILINLPDVIRSKGTQHSIKVFLRAVGIDPENSVRLREFGGPTTRQLSFCRENKRDVGTMVEFITSSLAVSPYLTASRYEPGYPQIRGQFVQQNKFPPNGLSNDVNDGLLTSGSWTVETIVKYTPTHIKRMTNPTQSLARMCVGLTLPDGDSLGLIANLLAISSSIDPKLMLYLRPGNNTASPLLLLSMSIPDNAIFDSDKWNVSFGCQRNDSIGSRVSSSYFLRLGNQNDGELQHFQTTASFFLETATTESNAYRLIDATFNTSGTFLAIGENHLIPSSGGNYIYLNNTSSVNAEARVTAFTGMQSNLRFWSKALTEEEWAEHIRNYKSLGVEDPLVNYNFVTTRSGSFEKVRMDTFTKQETKRANASASLGPLGTITFLDFSLNGNHMSGSGFPIDMDCVKGELFDYSYLSPYFDEAATNEKIRIRSFQNQKLVDATPWAQVAPIHEIVKSEQPTDDVRFSVEFSLIDSLNRDIITLFATLNAIDNALGAPELIFSPDYPDLDKLRNIYFNRIREKLNFKGFFEFFRWFDTSIGTFIQQLIPRKTNFRGTNFVIESHMLERHKLEYLFNEMYLGEEDRSRIRDVLLLQQITGDIRKY